MSMPRKIRCTVESIIDHGGRVYTVDLVPAAPVPSFRAGQFLHLTVDDYDPAGFWPESRVFSIASSPKERARLRICYSVKGRYTTRMEERLSVGGEVWVKLPYGDFVIEDSGAAVLIAGGTGISAFTAFLEALTPQDSQAVTLVYGARTPGLLLFQEMILAQLAAVPQLDVVFFTETADQNFAQRIAAQPRAPRCLTGRISLESVLRPLTSEARSLRSETSSTSSVPCAPTSIFYLSGPPVMLTMLGTELQALGVTSERIRTDAWE
jgi:ferredoxin-NADP reductase